MRNIPRDAESINRASIYPSNCALVAFGQGDNSLVTFPGIGVFKLLCSLKISTGIRVDSLSSFLLRLGAVTDASIVVINKSLSSSSSPAC